MSDRQVRRLTRLVDDLLDVSRITQGKIALHREPVSIADAVGDAADAVRPSIEQRQQRLVLRLPGSAPVVLADGVRLAQVFENLLSNASKYTDPGGEIAVEVDDTDDAVRIRVRDTGVGLPPDQLERVFELFTQVASSRDRAQGGLGIGLSLVRQLVELHGGTVSASSDGPGRGACFVVTLPRAPAAVEAA
jgi:signal transduction histidine kinase